MGLKCGIVGLPNVGKSTLFNAISTGVAEAANFPFCTIEPNIGTINVPDERLGILDALVNPEKVVPTFIEFVDIAGLVKGASKGEGLGNKFLGNIREVNAIVHVIRCFEDENIVHVDGEVNPIKDKEVIDTELQFKDLESVEKRISRVEKIAKSGDGTAKKEMAALEKVKIHLESGSNVRALDLDDNEKELLSDLQLLTIIPVIYVANVDEDSVVKGNTLVSELKNVAHQESAEVIVVCAALEEQIAELDEDERGEFLEEYGLTESGLSKLIRSSYKILNLITYFTAGKQEVKAWTIGNGWKAPQAAGVIHTDFEKGFIKAEVIKLDHYQEYKTEVACREAGKVSIEGKDYVVQDGDIMHFRFNV